MTPDLEKIFKSFNIGHIRKKLLSSEVTVRFAKGCVLNIERGDMREVLKGRNRHLIKLKAWSSLSHHHRCQSGHQL